MPTELLTVTQAAAALGIRPSTMRSWISKRKIEFCKIGRCVRIPRQVIEAFVSRNTVAAEIGNASSL